MSLEQEFHREAMEGVRRCKAFDYNPTYFLRMVADHGAVGAVKLLLKGERASDGFTRLWEEGRLDLSVECLVLLPKYEPLFTGDERAEARRRLELYEFDVDRHLAAHIVAQPPTPQPASQVSTTGVRPESPEAPVVVPIVTAYQANGIWPTVDDLATARQLFGTHEPRDVFYRAATYLVDQALQGQAPLTVADALGVLLQTWNRAYYHYHGLPSNHYEEIEALLIAHEHWLASVRGRRIETLSSADEAEINRIFTSFEAVLGPVGAAKALHLLAPCFLPLWDRAIAVAYGCQLGNAGTNGGRYVRFAKNAKDQAARVGPLPSGTNVLKALDEYNYCRFTKGWM